MKEKIDKLLKLYLFSKMFPKYMNGKRVEFPQMSAEVFKKLMLERDK